MIPCPLCPILHITLSEVSTGDTIFCPQCDDAELPLGYYGDLTPSGSGDPTLMKGVPICITSIRSL